jgi:hypothetical protein
VTAEDPNSIDRTEQKRAFAVRYFVNKNDAIMHAAKVLGQEAVDNPMLAINYGNSWPFDSVVIAELERLSNASRSKGEYEAIAHKSFETCMERGEESAAVRFLELAATLAGYVNKRAVSAKEDNPNGDGHEQDLIDAIVDPNNRRDDSQAEVVSTWQ